METQELHRGRLIDHQQHPPGRMGIADVFADTKAVAFNEAFVDVLGRRVSALVEAPEINRDVEVLPIESGPALRDVEVTVVGA